jgi:hypothetical protein
MTRQEIANYEDNRYFSGKPMHSAFRWFMASGALMRFVDFALERDEDPSYQILVAQLPRNVPMDVWWRAYESRNI